MARKPLIVPETADALEVLDTFQVSGEQLALVVDEHGGIDGIVTLTGLVRAAVGDL
ncbi:MAG: CBS domain-containing protein [Bryobacterales bacterium]|nr:CBS domain-containing protein [Bryobacterales bacterium]